MPQYVSREDYFTAAVSILAEAGFRELTMTELHRRLGVSSGSFYNWFRNRADFVDQFLAHWAEHTAEIARQAAEPREPMERLRLLRQLARTVPHDAEAAIRAWSAADPAVAAAQERVDRRRHELVRSALTQVTGTDDEDLAHMCLALVVGEQMMHRPVDVDALDRLLARFIDLVSTPRSPMTSGTGTPEAPASEGS